MVKSYLIGLFMLMFLVPIVIGGVDLPTLTVFNPFTGTFDYAWWINNSDSCLYNDGGYIRFNTSCDNVGAPGSSPWLDNGTYVVLNASYASDIKMIGNLDMDGNQVTNVGKLVMTGLATMYNATPTTDSLYSLGNSTHRWKELWVDDIYAGDISTTNLTSTNIDSDDVNSGTVDVSKNMTIGGYTILNQTDSMVVLLI